MSKIKAILWDLDSTLLDPKQPQRRAIQKCFDYFGFGKCSEEQLDMYPVINDRLWLNLLDESMTRDQIAAVRFEQFLDFCGKDSSCAEEFNHVYTDFMGEVIYPCPNAFETIDFFRKEVPQYIVTNGTEYAQMKKIKQAGLDKRVDGIFISESIGYDKPKKELFDIILDKIGIEDRRSIIMVGDSLYTDIPGAINAGIVACWYNPKHEKNEIGVKPDYEISNLSQLTEILY